MSKKILENLIKYNSNEKMYKDNLLKIEEKIGKNKEQQLNYMKK